MLEPPVAFRVEHGGELGADDPDAHGAHCGSSCESVDRVETPVIAEPEEDYVTANRLDELEREMKEAAANLDFERAAMLRDRIQELQVGR